MVKGMTTTDVIKYISWYATRQDIALTTNRLVKFMYLFDYYYAKIVGQKFSKLPWAFVYYGPYCTEAMNTIDQAVKYGDIDKKTFDSKYDIEKEFHLFKCYDPDAEQIEQSMNFIVLSKIQWAIRQFGDDTAELLDYVYFDTEPMKDAHKGDLLDFSKVEKFKPAKVVKRRNLTKEEIEKAKGLISRMGKKYEDGQKRLVAENERVSKFKTESYRKLVQFLDRSEPLPDFDGIAHIEMQ